MGEGRESVPGALVRGLRWTAHARPARLPWAHGLLWAACVLAITMLSPAESERFIYFQF